MKRLPICALALLAWSCSPHDQAKPRIGLALRSAGDAASSGVLQAIEKAASDRAELEIIDGENRQSAQDAQTKSLLERKPKAIAVNPVDGNSLAALIASAKASRVPLVFFGPPPSRESMRSWDKLFFVGTRPVEAGLAQAEMLAAYWKTNDGADRNKDGVLQFALLMPLRDRPDAEQQAEAFAKSLAASGIRSLKLASEGAESGIPASRQKAAAILAQFGDKIEAFVCCDDDTTLGAIQALSAAGHFKGKRRTQVVGSSEGELTEAIAADLASELLLGTALIDPARQGKAVFDLAYALARGAPPSRTGWKIIDAKYVWVPCMKVTKDKLPPKK